MTNLSDASPRFLFGAEKEEKKSKMFEEKKRDKTLVNSQSLQVPDRSKTYSFNNSSKLLGKSMSFERRSTERVWQWTLNLNHIRFSEELE